MPDKRLTETWPEVADLLRDADPYALRCVAADVGLLAARAASVAGLDPIGAALDRLRSAPVLEQLGIDPLAPIRSGVRSLTEERGQRASDPSVSPTVQVRLEARALTAINWALHPDPVTAAAGATYEALQAGCDERELASVVRRAAAEIPPN